MPDEINHTRANFFGEFGFRGRLRCLRPPAHRAKAISVPTGERQINEYKLQKPNGDRLHAG
jgi:hypothetical protein